MSGSYRGLSGQGLDDAYATRCLAPYADATLARQAEVSNAVVREYRPLHLDYGAAGSETPDNCLDLFVPDGEGPWPLVAFIHGGYWQRLIMAR